MLHVRLQEKYFRPHPDKFGDHSRSLSPFSAAIADTLRQTAEIQEFLSPAVYFKIDLAGLFVVIEIVKSFELLQVLGHRGNSRRRLYFAAAAALTATGSLPIAGQGKAQ